MGNINDCFITCPGCKEEMNYGSYTSYHQCREEEQRAIRSEWDDGRAPKSKNGDAHPISLDGLFKELYTNGEINE